MAVLKRKKVTRQTRSPKAKAKPSVRVPKNKPLKQMVKATSHLAPLYDASGNKKGSVTIPKEVFGATVNTQLLAQAVRVYQANQRSGSASTKTRGEVRGSTRKIYRQKGTGKARHGAIRAPIFVGGGVTFGPKPRNYHQTILKKMGKVALSSALTSQWKSGNILFVDGMMEIAPKTKLVVRLLQAVGVEKSALLVVPDNAQSLMLGARNIPEVSVMPVSLLHAYSVLSHRKVIIAKESIPKLKETFVHTS